MDDSQLPAETAGEPAAGSAEATEAALTAIWMEVLGVERVGPDDTFFDLGGQSALLLQVHERLQERLGREIPLMDLFQHPTVRSLAQRLERGDDAPTAADAALAARERANERREMRSRRRDPRRGR